MYRFYSYKVAHGIITHRLPYNSVIQKSVIVKDNSMLIHAYIDIEEERIECRKFYCFNTEDVIFDKNFSNLIFVDSVLYNEQIYHIYYESRLDEKLKRK
jgi:hypothetical protein